jgi:hypothetical protein
VAAHGAPKIVVTLGVGSPGERTRAGQQIASREVAAGKGLARNQLQNVVRTTPREDLRETWGEGSGIKGGGGSGGEGLRKP